MFPRFPYSDADTWVCTTKGCNLSVYVLPRRTVVESSFFAISFVYFNFNTATRMIPDLH